MSLFKKIFKKVILVLSLSLGIFLISNNFLKNNIVFAKDPVPQNTDVKKGENKKEDSLQSVVNFLNKILSFISWFWVIPAIIAGKLMTNGWIYGSNLHLDSYLWQMWRTMVNFANFFLGFLFVGLILWSFFKGTGGDLIKNKLPRIILALVLINFSWFFIGVLVDISNVLTAMVGSIPSSLGFVNESDIKGLTLPEKIEINLSDNYGITVKEVKKDVSLDSILPKYDSVSGPLIYFGASVLGLFSINSANFNAVTWSQLFQDKLLEFILAVMFILPLIVLAIVNFIRILWIWIFIIFSPFVIIEAVMGGMISKKVEAFKKLSLGNLIGLIFMPVAVVGVLSIGLIFVVSLENMLKNPPENGNVNPFIKQFECSTKSSNYVCFKTNTEKVYISKNSIFKDAGQYATGVLGKLILFGFVIFFLWSLLPIGFKMSELTSNISDGIFKFTGEIAKAAPILPGGLSYAAVKKGLSKRMLGTEVFERVQAKQAQGVIEAINSLTGVYDKKLTPLEYNKLQEALREGRNAASKIVNFSEVLSKIAEKKKPGWSLQTDPQLRELVKELLLEIGKDKNLRNKFHIFEVNKDGKVTLKPNWENSTEVGRLLEALVNGEFKNANTIETDLGKIAGRGGVPAYTLNLGKGK